MTVLNSMMIKIVTKLFVKKLFPPRDPWSHKGNFGRLLVIGGSKSYSGAPAFAALAALKTGVDVVDILAPRRAADIAATFAPDLITHPQRGDFLNSWHLHDAFFLEKHVTAIVLGNGMGRRPETEAFATEFLKKTSKPSVLDADALHIIKEARSNWILTPHTQEFFVLTGKKLTTDLRERQVMVQESAKEFGCTMLVKGHSDIISNGDQTMLSKTGNPYMTKGGTGDTLAGICGALLARGIKPFDAAAAAAWINGSAGDLAARQFRQSFMASDLISSLSAVLK